MALLEYIVNVNIEDIPRALSIASFEISESEIYELKETDLSGNCREVPAPSSAKDPGSNLLIAKKPILKIPSIVITEEFNYILNPLYSGSKNFKIRENKRFCFMMCATNLNNDFIVARSPLQ